VKDKIIFKTALTFAIIGILILFVIVENTTIDEKQINNITENDLEKTVRISGEITKIKQTKAATFLEVSQKNSIDIVIFEVKNFSVGKKVEILGKVDKSDNNYQIIANKISVKS